MTVERHSYFSWNLGALLGSAVGFGGWMIAVPLAAGWHRTGVLAGLACGTIILLSAPVLWSMRNRISAFQGMLIHLTVAFMATLGMLSFAHVMKLPLISLPPSMATNAADSFWMLLLFPALALLCWFISRSGKISTEPGA